MDLLRYSETNLKVCLKDKPKREIHDILRAAAVHPTRVAVCNCTKDPWVRKTLTFLGVRLYNESSGEHVGPNAH